MSIFTTAQKEREKTLTSSALRKNETTQRIVASNSNTLTFRTRHTRRDRRCLLRLLLPARPFLRGAAVLFVGVGAVFVRAFSVDICVTVGISVGVLVIGGVF
jgi:hypothetical protein